MRKETKNIIDKFSDKFSSDMELIESMQRGTADVFVNDPEYADVLKTFANSFVNIGIEMNETNVRGKKAPEVISTIITDVNRDKMEKVAIFCTVLYTMLKNLDEAGIIKIIPKHERKTREIWDSIKDRIPKNE